MSACVCRDLQQPSNRAPGPHPACRAGCPTSSPAVACLRTAAKMTIATVAVDPADPTRLLARALGSPSLRFACVQRPGQPLVRRTQCAPQGMGHQVEAVGGVGACPHDRMEARTSARQTWEQPNLIRKRVRSGPTSVRSHPLLIVAACPRHPSPEHYWLSPHRVLPASCG